MNLYDKDDNPESKNEIDILAMLDGAFYAVEAKVSASTFLNKAGSIDKFVKIVGLLQPDVALLAFERYCAEEKDTEATKATLVETGNHIRERIGPWTKLEILVAQDVPGFSDFPTDLGWRGRRLRNRKYYE